MPPCVQPAARTPPDFAGRRVGSLAHGRNILSSDCTLLLFPISVVIRLKSSTSAHFSFDMFNSPASLLSLTFPLMYLFLSWSLDVIINSFSASLALFFRFLGFPVQLCGRGCLCVPVSVCESQGDHVCVSAFACVYTLVGECACLVCLCVCVGVCLCPSGDAGSSVLRALLPAAELLCVCSSRLPVQHAPGPGCDSTRHRVEQR